VSNANRRELGERLKALRKQNELTSPELSKRTGVSQSAISKIENGLLKPTNEFVESFISATKLSKDEADDLRDCFIFFQTDFDLWSAYETGCTARMQKAVLEKEKRSKILSSFQWSVLFGVVQIKKYSEHILRICGVKNPDELRSALEFRIQQQKLLFNKSKNFKLIFSETALRIKICPPSVMIEQLEWLQTVSEFENVELRLLPLDAPLPIFSLNGFGIFDHKLVEVESMTAVSYLWREEDVNYYLNLFRGLSECSVVGQKATRLIEKIKQGLHRRVN